MHLVKLINDKVSDIENNSKIYKHVKLNNTEEKF